MRLATVRLNRLLWWGNSRLFERKNESREAAAFGCKRKAELLWSGKAGRMAVSARICYARRLRGISELVAVRVCRTTR